MKLPDKRNHDGNRQRCIGCGHPRVEHRSITVACSVPKCTCEQYTQQIVLESAKAAPSSVVAQ